LNNPWDSLRDYRPERLEQVREEIERYHTRRAELDEPETDRVERLRELLQATDDSEIGRLAGELERLDLMAVADLLLGEQDTIIIEKALSLSAAARLSDLVRRSWMLAVRTKPERSLVRLVSIGIENGLGQAIAPNATRVASWVRDGDLPLGLLLDLEAGGEPLLEWFDGLPALEVDIDRDGALMDELRVQLLTASQRRTLETHRGDLLGWVRELSSKTRSTLREDFTLHYLGKLREGRGWDEEIVDWILESFGEPDVARVVGIWRRLEDRSPGCVRDLASWLAMRRLEEWFDEVPDPHGRFEFWRSNFASSLIHAEAVAGREAILLHLPPIVVVEFAHVGNAAYLYPESQLSWLQSIRAARLDDYKNKDRLIRRPSRGEPYRIIHFQGWQLREAPELRRLIR